MWRQCNVSITELIITHKMMKKTTDTFIFFNFNKVEINIDSVIIKNENIPLSEIIRTKLLCGGWPTI